MFEGAKWFQVDFGQARFLLKNVYKNYDKWLTKAYGQKALSEQYFTLSKMTEQLGKILKPLEEKIPENVSINLPKLKKVSDNKVKLPKLKKV